jgi:hypothetical protein
MRLSPGAPLSPGSGPETLAGRTGYMGKTIGPKAM